MSHGKGRQGSNPSTALITPSSSAPRRTIRSQDLFGTQLEVTIEHKQRTYRLRITSGGKLILTA